MLDPSVQPQSISPFLQRDTRVVLTSPTKLGTGACYLLRSEAKIGDDPNSLKKLSSRTRQLAKHLESPVYVVGEVDAVADGERAYLNWLGTPLGENIDYALATVAYLISQYGDAINALATASYMLRCEVNLGEAEDPASVARRVAALLD